MSNYHAPVRDQRFVLETVVDIAGLAALPRFAEATPDLVGAILEEAGRQAADSVAPLNRPGDEEGARLGENGVITAKGFKEAYQSYVDAGWNGLASDPAFGGQGLPFVLACAVQEDFCAANMSFSLCPMLNHGATDALAHHGSDALKALYLEKMIAGEWTSTMNLTEPNAGSDVGALKTKATPVGDGTYKINGTKIFITFGDHDMTENIIHLVLARTPDAPEGTRGISMFIVPKYRLDADGNSDAFNDVKCVSVEHKLGIHASPTCVMSFGDNDDCIGWLVGEENQGMRNMFTMMNNARINVGLQGVSIAERATQKAAAYARDRVQGNAMGMETPGPHAIIHHADVRRMLMHMRALTEASRVLTYFNAACVDRSIGEEGDDKRNAARGLAELLTPLTKAFCTDAGVEVASLGVQVHGGMGYIEETGAAQLLRDARIAPIYEGTNGIQALDLVGRKLAMDGGSHWRGLFDEMAAFAVENHHPNLLKVVEVTRETAEELLTMAQENPGALGAGAVPFLRMMALTVSGWLLTKGMEEAKARIAAGDDDPFWTDKVATVKFFACHIMQDVFSLKTAALCGDELLYAIDADRL